MHMTDKKAQPPPEPDEDDLRGIDPGISDVVLRLFKQATTAKSRPERTKALLGLAEQFAAEHDLTDFTATDDWHAYIEEYLEARQKATTAALRLGRLAVHTLTEHFEANEVTEDEVAEQATRSMH